MPDKGKRQAGRQDKIGDIHIFGISPGTPYLFLHLIEELKVHCTFFDELCLLMAGSLGICYQYRIVLVL